MSYLESLFSLKGKTALVTGAGRGVGLAYARALAGAGATVAVLLHPSEDDAEVLATFGDLNAPVHVFRADLLDRDQVRNVFPTIQASSDLVIDIFVNNAGIAHREDILSYPEDRWYDLLQINLSTGFVLARDFVQDVLRRGARGKLISTSSVGGFLASRNTVAYTAAKHGVNALTKSFSTEFASRGINANAIAPGYTVTALTEANLAQNGARYLQRIPIGRFAETADLEGAVVFLASPASDYVTGHVLAVDGGRIVADYEPDVVAVDAKQEGVEN